jgi:hypothetical protein
MKTSFRPCDQGITDCSDLHHAAARIEAAQVNQNRGEVR